HGDKRERADLQPCYLHRTVNLSCRNDMKEVSTKIFSDFKMSSQDDSSLCEECRLKEKERDEAVIVLSGRGPGRRRNNEKERKVLLGPGDATRREIRPDVFKTQDLTNSDGRPTVFLLNLDPNSHNTYSIRGWPLPPPGADPSGFQDAVMAEEALFGIVPDFVEGRARLSVDVQFFIPEGKRGTPERKKIIKFKVSALVKRDGQTFGVNTRPQFEGIASVEVPDVDIPPGALPEEFKAFTARVDLMSDGTASLEPEDILDLGIVRIPYADPQRELLKTAYVDGIAVHLDLE